MSVLLRNVVGLRTFGFFLPMLVSIAAVRTGLAWGIFAFLTVIVLISLLRPSSIGCRSSICRSLRYCSLG